MKGTHVISLPEVAVKSETSIEQALHQRRSIRDYRNIPLTLKEAAQILWAAQGVTDAMGLRTAPSAGALYPLECHLVSGNVENLPPAVYHYNAQLQELMQISEGDKREEISRAALHQMWIKEAAAVIVLSAVFERITSKYGERGIRYAHMEVGHAAQNICLQSISLGMGTVVVGAFEDEEVQRIIKAANDVKPLCLLPIGKH
ncbi:MAG: SagB/ThcOx family dehydrogenase [Waddliaceae bacterium]